MSNNDSIAEILTNLKTGCILTQRAHEGAKHPHHFFLHQHEQFITYHREDNKRPPPPRCKFFKAPAIFFFVSLNSRLYSSNRWCSNWIQKSNIRSTCSSSFDRRKWSIIFVFYFRYLKCKSLRNHVHFRYFIIIIEMNCI